MKPIDLFQDKNLHTLEDVLLYAQEKEGYLFIWAVQCNEVILGKLESARLDLTKLAEARIFGNGCEIHVFWQDKWIAIETVGWTQYYMDETQKIKKADQKRFGSSIQIRHYISFGEEAGEKEKPKVPQAYICGSCLNGWRE